MSDPPSKRLFKILRFLFYPLFLVLLSLFLNLFFLRWTTLPVKEGAIAPRTITAPRTLTLMLPEPSPGGVSEGASVRILTLSPGDLIVQKGELVSSPLYHALRAQNLVPPDFSPLSLFSIFLYFAFLFGVLFFFFSSTLKKEWKFSLHRLFLFALYAFTLTSLFFLAVLREKTGWDWVPLPAGIAVLLLHHTLGIASVPFFLLSIPLLFPGTILGYEVVTFPVLLAGLASSASLTTVKQHQKSIFAGVFSLTLLLSRILSGETLHPAPQEGLTLGLMFLGIYGIGSGLLRVLPGAFGFTSRERLLELLNPDSPLLKELAARAPGTYAHSEQMALLAEQAAVALGADPLVTRIGALYHDIGKMKHPKFFIENQSAGKNPHDDLPATMSARIVMSHVKEGEELARAHRLPPEIISFIRTHHGTSRVSFFYQRAVEDAGESFLTPPPPAEFRYPGPLPRTREETLIMLVDSMEAILRTQPHSSTDSIRQTLWNITYQKMRDHQLDESVLSLSELSRAIEKMLEFISGGAHKRVEYPQPEVSHPDPGATNSRI